MKTKTTNQKFNLTKGILVMMVILVCLSAETSAQEQDSTKSLFGSNVKVSEIWTPEIKINSIQGDVGTLIGFYGGAVFNHSILLGISGGVNLSHPTGKLRIFRCFRAVYLQTGKPLALQRTNAACIRINKGL